VWRIRAESEFGAPLLPPLRQCAGAGIDRVFAEQLFDAQELIVFCPSRTVSVPSCSPFQKDEKTHETA
jgi:hypothetical protein